MRTHCTRSCCCCCCCCVPQAPRRRCPRGQFGKVLLCIKSYQLHRHSSSKPSKAVKSHLKLPPGLATQGTTSKQYFGHSIRIFMPPENARSSAYALRSERSGGSLVASPASKNIPLEVVFLKSSTRYLNNHRQMAVTHLRVPSH